MKWPLLHPLQQHPRVAREVDEAYLATLAMDQEMLVQAWADWTEELAQEGEPSVQEGR